MTLNGHNVPPPAPGAPSEELKAKRLPMIAAAAKRYKRERARMEYTLRRAGSNEPLDLDELPSGGSLE